MFKFLSNDIVNLINPLDFQANARGELSELQRKRLSGLNILGRLAIRIVPMMIILCVVLGILGVSFTQLMEEDFFTTIFFLCLSGMVFASIPISLFQQRSDLILLFKWPAIQQDINNRAIRSTQGTSAYRNDGYVFETMGQDLSLPANMDSGLIPGAPYIIYYLEQSGMVLSAEAAGEPKLEQVASTIQETLYKFHGFGPNELAANRNGEILGAQRLKPAGRAGLALILGMIALLFGVSFVGAVQSNPKNVVVLAIVLLTIFLVLMGLSIWMFIQGIMDVNTATVSQVTGPGRKEERITRTGRSGSQTTYYYVISGVSFQVSRKAYQAFVEGLQYRAYYLPRTKILLSLEVVGL